MQPALVNDHLSKNIQIFPVKRVMRELLVSDQNRFLEWHLYSFLFYFFNSCKCPLDTWFTILCYSEYVYKKLLVTTRRCMYCKSFAINYLLNSRCDRPLFPEETPILLWFLYASDHKPIRPKHDMWKISDLF